MERSRALLDAGKMVFLWQPDSFSVISTASNRGYKLPVPTTMAQSVDWVHLDSFPPLKNSLSINPFHTWNGKVVFLWPPDSFSVISTASNHGYKLPVPTTMASGVHWLRLDSFPPMENTSTNPSTHGKVIFLSPPDSFSVISTASNHGYKLPVPTAVEQCRLTPTG